MVIKNKVKNTTNIKGSKIGAFDVLERQPKIKTVI